jgi:signal transduction histidine kinase
MKLLGSLTNRIFLACALLAVVSVGMAIYVVNVQVAGHAEAEIERGLTEAASLAEQYRLLLFENVIRQARLIADLPRFKAAVALDDPPTLLPLAEEYQRETRSDLFVVTNRAGRVLAYVGHSRVTSEQVSRLRPIQQSLLGRPITSFWPAPGGMLQVISVPIWIDREQPEVLGSLSIGFGLDHALAERFRALTEAEIFFVSEGRIHAGTRPAVGEEFLGDLINRDGFARVDVGDNEYVGLSRAIGSLTNASPVLGAGVSAGELSDEPVRPPRLVILRSRTDSLRFLNSIHTILAVTALLGVLGAVILSYAVARTVTRPLGAIVESMRRMAATGDLTSPIALPAGRLWDDDDARLLATTLNGMTQSIARFQREATMKERLSSLGRLSTVMAHEIRNPLMIIKAALRTLRRGDAPPEEARAAVADIDEEVARLNRIVGEVLDFARPIRFQYETVQLNALCRDAASAAAAGEAGPSIELRLDDTIPPVRTDGERLRIGLVNVLSNARHAVVEARNRPSDTGPGELPSPTGDLADPAPIELVTERLPGGRFAIVVRDRGIGIDADDLPRVFDPYFTRKRAGSGLGLAITKNVVEGLGGTISVASRTGLGTEIRIELGTRPGHDLIEESA